MGFLVFKTSGAGESSRGGFDSHPSPPFTFHTRTHPIDLTRPIDVPLWILIILCTFTLWAAFDRMLMPSVRWYIRRKVNLAISQVNSRLRMTMRPFHLTKRQVLIDRLVYDTEVVNAMHAFADEKQMPREVAQAQVIEYAKEIVPAFNAYIYFRFGYWLSRKLSKLLYRVRVRLLDQELIENVDPEATVVFVMNHRSNMDYILISYLVAQQSTLSYAVGEWAQVWPLNTLIKAMGAFFVRRDSRNPLYRAILQRYVHMATKEGVCQAVFLEGGLSHDGKMRPPKMGFLNYMLRHYDPKNDRDIIFVPIALNYDRILEDKNLLIRKNPDAPKPTKRQMIRNAFRFYRRHLAGGTRKRQRNFGYAGVNFGRPLSIREYAKQHAVNFQNISDEEGFQTTQRLAETLMTEIRYVIPILPVPLLATLFQQHPDAALTAFEVKTRAMDLVQTLQDAGAPIRDQEKPQEATIERALSQMLHHQILIEENGHYQTNPAQHELLNFYANSLEHWTVKNQE